MTSGNIIFGGLVGVAIDAGSGAMHLYPETVVVVLPPEKFPSESERDSFFQRQKTRVSDNAAAQITKVTQQCGKDEPSRLSCEEKTKRIEAARDAEIARFKSQRQIARVN